PPEIRAVVEHVKRLSRAQDEDGTWHNHFIDHPDRTPLVHEPPPPFSQMELERGADLFLGSFCVNCHGPEGGGDGTSAEWLVDADGVSIRPRDLRNAIYQRGAGVREIFLRIRCGIPGTPMPSLSSNVPDADAWAIAYYVRSLQREPVDLVERGKLLYRAHGCIDCHSEDLVGIPNPGATNGWTTPMMTLAERSGLRSAAEAARVVDALRSGRRPAGPAGRALERFREAVQRGAAAVPAGPDAAPVLRRMPGWGDRLSHRDVDALFAYCLTLQLWLEGDAEPDPRAAERGG
ncbi:MAG: c-type cytochrome, partial [Planctomycetota bacterium]